MIGMLLIGIMAAFGSMIMAILVLGNTVSPIIYIATTTIFGVLGGLTLIIVTFLTRGVLDPFLSGKLRRRDIIAVITPSKRIELLSAKEEGGMFKTERGYFITSPDSVYRWPNGVNGGIAYYKYGSTLPPKYIKATGKLKEAGITDIAQLELVKEKVKKEGKKDIIKVD